MSEVEEQQEAICLLKLNLENIEKELILQKVTFYDVDKENQQKYQEALAAFDALRSYHQEINNLKLENGHLVVKRLELKRQTDEIVKQSKTVYKHRDSLTEALRQEEREIEQQVYKYADTLREKAERLRTSRKYYIEEEVNKEFVQVNGVIGDLGAKLVKKQSVVDELWTIVDDIHPDVPEQLLDIIGKQELEAKLKAVTEEYESLVEKLKKTTGTEMICDFHVSC